MVTPIEAEELHYQMDEGMEPAVIVMTIKEAVDNGARNLKYITTILDTWRTNNCKTVEAVEAYKRDWQDKKNGKGKPKEPKPFNPDFPGGPLCKCKGKGVLYLDENGEPADERDAAQHIICPCVDK
jgi:DnaD/phage-associated family protein